MTWEILFASILLAAVAALGVLRPFGAPRRVALERLADPLEDERLSLLRSLRDLEEERADGDLTDEAYRTLRAETEGRAVAVLRALEAREGAGELAAGLRELRAEPSGNGLRSKAQDDGKGRRTWVVAALATAGVALVAVALLLAAVRARTPGAPITGTNEAATATSNPLAFFEQRVRDHPDDVAARLDLADRYLTSGNVQGAIVQYLAALRLDPRNAEAHANLGLVLFRAGRSQDALDAENKALRTDPTYAAALYFKGVILLQGLNRPAEAADAFRAYLQTAPFGSYRSEVQRLLQQAESKAKS
jgi:cytochrome c-type biogenesis protein CcmH/NrfG